MGLFWLAPGSTVAATLMSPPKNDGRLPPHAERASRARAATKAASGGDFPADNVSSPRTAFVRSTTGTPFCTARAYRDRFNRSDGHTLPQERRNELTKMSRKRQRTA